MVAEAVLEVFRKASELGISEGACLHVTLFARSLYSLLLKGYDCTCTVVLFGWTTTTDFCTRCGSSFRDCSEQQLHCLGTHGSGALVLILSENQLAVKLRENP